jgi:hypothetical protein
MPQQMRRTGSVDAGKFHVTLHHPHRHYSVVCHSLRVTRPRLKKTPLTDVEKKQCKWRNKNI